MKSKDNKNISRKRKEENDKLINRKRRRAKKNKKIIKIKQKRNNKEEIKNKIIIKLKIEENDINKDIYFLNNPIIEINGENKNCLGLKELNELNTNIYINNKKYKYKKSHKFKKKGEYIIEIDLNILLKDCNYNIYRKNNGFLIFIF